MTKRSSVSLGDNLRDRTFQQYRPRQFYRETIQSLALIQHAALCTCASSRLLLSACRCARSRFNHLHEIANCPERVRDASGHCWRATNGDVRFHEIVISVVQSDRRFEVFQLLRKSVGQPRETSAVHSQCVILFFDMACRNQIDNGISCHRNPFHVHHFGRGISAGFDEESLFSCFGGTALF